MWSFLLDILFHPQNSIKCSGSLVSPYITIVWEQFYFRATLGVEEVLQLSKNSTSIFLKWFLILNHSHSLKCVLEKMCVCVCVSLSLSLWPSPIVEPKPIDRSRSNSIYRVLMYISRADVLVFPPNPKIKGSSHEKKFKIRIFQKWL